MVEKFEGIVLFNRPHRDNDGLIKLLTKDYGSRMFFVRGLKKTNFTMAGQAQPLTHNLYVGTINQSGLSFLNEATSIHSFRQIHSNLTKQAHASYLAQLVDASLADQEIQAWIYDLLLTCLEAYNDKSYPDIITLWAEIRLLKQFGVGLNWQTCTVCGRSEGPFDFSINYQGLLCQQHYSEDPFRMHMNPRALNIMQVLAHYNLADIGSVQVSSETVKDMRRLMDEIYQEFVGLRLKSKSFLDQLSQMSDQAQQLSRIRQSKQNKKSESEGRWNEQYTFET